MVSQSEHGGPHHLSPGILCLAGGQTVVGAVLQTALARHHRHLPEGPRPGQAGTQEDHRPPGEKDSDEVRNIFNYIEGASSSLVFRYCLLSYILCIRRFSSRLKKRFPDMKVFFSLFFFVIFCYIYYRSWLKQE